MRINILQHTPNEGPGSIATWAKGHGHEVYIYHSYQFGYVPSADETDMLVILGGPMSPNDDLPWIEEERELVKTLMARNIPIFGACFGAQLISLTLGGEVTQAPVKEVGWAPVYRQTDVIPGLPEQLTVLHWHQDMFSIPTGATRLFSSDRVANQGFVIGHRVVGLQFHFEPVADDVREIVVNDFPYINGSVLGQTAADILATPVPAANQQAMFRILDYLTE